MDQALMEQRQADTVPLLDPAKFRDPLTTLDGTRRASVALERLDVLWINTGTLCNIECDGCYIESSPTNDRLAYISHKEMSVYLDEIEERGLPVQEIGFTGGEPFMNNDLLPMVEDALGRGFRVLILTNAMKPMWHKRDGLRQLRETYGEALALRVSIDHFTQSGHDRIRGIGAWEPMVAGLSWLNSEGFNITVAARMAWDETEEQSRRGYENLFTKLELSLNAGSPADLVLFPDMGGDADVPEITDACWGILDVNPNDMMCATSRMVVKRKGADTPVVLPCTLLPYDEAFDMGHRLADAEHAVHLNHPNCATFCVLGGASCSGGK